jgi:hypothetical protein
MTWTPSSGGHECLLAAVYEEDAVGGIATSMLLDGDTTWSQTLSVAQHNFSVVQMTGGMHHLPYHFEVWNSADQARDFEVEAWQAPLKGIEPFLPGIPGRQAVYERPGKVERLGIARAKADAAELAKAPNHTRVKIPPRSSHPFTLGISLSRGNALIHITQSLDRRIVGGLSVLAMAEAK